MGFGNIPECSKCNTKEADHWYKNGNNGVLCCKCIKSGSNDNSDTSCGMECSEQVENGVVNLKLFEKTATLNASTSKIRKDELEDQDLDKELEGNKNSDRRESRSRRSRKAKQGCKGSNLKGKGRRYIFKKSATKAPTAVSTPVTSDHLFYQGNYYQRGDIISVIDIEGGIYYAQIRGLLQDQYCEKSAVITWLIPTKNSPPPEEKFDPSTYIIGPEEDIPRKLEYLRFVARAPSDYYKDRNSPYATFNFRPQSCFVWSRLGPVIKPIESAEELMSK